MSFYVENADYFSHLECSLVLYCIISEVEH